MLISRRIFPTSGEPPTPQSFDSDLKLSWPLWVCHLVCRLKIKVFDLLSGTHLILISLCYALGLCHSVKSFTLPPSLLFHALFLSPIWAHDVATTIFWRNNQKIVGPWEGNIISNPSMYSGLHLPCFLQHVQQQRLSVNPLGWVTGTQCLLEIQGQLVFWG